jgi:hypothetical protein
MTWLSYVCFHFLLFYISSDITLTSFFSFCWTLLQFFLTCVCWPFLSNCFAPQLKLLWSCQQFQLCPGLSSKLPTVIYRPTTPNLRAAPPSASCSSNAQSFCWIVVFNDTVNSKNHLTSINDEWMRVFSGLRSSEMWRRADVSVFSDTDVRKCCVALVLGSAVHQGGTNRAEESPRVTSLKNWKNRSKSAHNRSDLSF